MARRRPAPPPEPAPPACFSSEEWAGWLSARKTWRRVQHFRPNPSPCTDCDRAGSFRLEQWSAGLCRLWSPIPDAGELAGEGGDQKSLSAALRPEAERQARANMSAGGKGAQIAQPLRVQNRLAAAVGLSGRTLDKAAALRPEAERQARERQAHGGPRSGKLPERSHAETRDRLASAVGLSGRTLGGRNGDVRAESEHPGDTLPAARPGRPHRLTPVERAIAEVERICAERS